jgi:NSS family neurotransmitter:Na+ symporter
VRLYQRLQKPGHKWHIHGLLAMLGNWVLMMFYTVVSGWMLHYFVTMIRGGFEGADVARVGAIYGEMLQSPGTLIFYMVITVVLMVKFTTAPHPFTPFSRSGTPIVQRCPCFP